MFREGRDGNIYLGESGFETFGVQSFTINFLVLISIIRAATAGTFESWDFDRGASVGIQWRNGGSGNFPRGQGLVFIGG